MYLYSSETKSGTSGGIVGKRPVDATGAGGTATQRIANEYTHIMVNSHDAAVPPHILGSRKKISCRDGNPELAPSLQLQMHPVLGRPSS